MDARLKYKEHPARAASKGLEAALEPKRLKGLSPAIGLCMTVDECIDAYTALSDKVFEKKKSHRVDIKGKLHADLILPSWNEPSSRSSCPRALTKMRCSKRPMRLLHLCNKQRDW
ncbi:hypothetical protein SAPIO_CDS4807 [Scedosporium apiospermum]|uniref:Uncharacterized protein n=1 Tax=Pseudallescheria apiosperma TaxID=563466 RepID=A0A084G7N9_PSEDA|nr:uncharacterized protein SAPIO_CDS4807 [Scedosporium apiospermum]KEZ43351.1 hypothetical protein SAPIO_CDS4807 [Scedosporium apiospermum]